MNNMKPLMRKHARKTASQPSINKDSIFVTLFLVSVIGAISAAFAIGPLVLLIGFNLASLLITMAISLSLGFNAAISIKDLEAKTKHHAVLNISIFISSVFVFLTLWLILQNLQEQYLHIPSVNPISILGLSIVYSVSFLLPYAAILKLKSKTSLNQVNLDQSSIEQYIEIEQ